METFKNQENYPTDPFKYIEDFRSSKEYETAYEIFFRGKTPDDDVTEQEKRNAFEGDEKARKALIDYARNSDSLGYDRNKYSDEFNDCLKTYHEHIEEYDIFQENYNLSIYDELRGTYHNNAATILEKDLKIPHILAIGIVQLLTVSSGVENWSNSELDRTMRKIIY